MKQKKKLAIALVSSYEFTEEPGGVKDFILGLKQALLRNNCTVKVIAPGSKDAQKKGLVDYVLGIGFKLATDQTQFRASLSRKETARKILETVKPDIIVLNEPFLPSIGHTIISAIAENEIQRPIVVGQFHASREDINWPLKAVEFIFRHFIRRPKLDRKGILGWSSGYVDTINNNLDGRIVVSEATKNFWQKKLPAEYKIIYNGIDTDELNPNGPKINGWMKDKRRIILFAGRHDPRKGIEDLINAFNTLLIKGEDMRLKITGKGEMTKFLQETVKKMGLQKYIKFTGVLSRSELVKAYRTADLLVAPSVDGEGFNRTIIEARSCGTLVVCTDIGGQNEAIGKDLTPFMAKPKDPQDLARKIMEVLNLSKAKKQTIAKRGSKEIKANFSWDKIVKQHIQYYKSLISQTR